MFILYSLVPVRSVRMEVNLGCSNTKQSGEHRGTGVVHVRDAVALWVDAEIPLSASVKCQFAVAV